MKRKLMQPMNGSLVLCFILSGNELQLQKSRRKGQKRIKIKTSPTDPRLERDIEGKIEDCWFKKKWLCQITNH